MVTIFHWLISYIIEFNCSWKKKKKNIICIALIIAILGSNNIYWTIPKFRSIIRFLFSMKSFYAHHFINCFACWVVVLFYQLIWEILRFLCFCWVVTLILNGAWLSWIFWFCVEAEIQCKLYFLSNISQMWTLFLAK